MVLAGSYALLDADGYPYATRVPQAKTVGDGGVEDG